MPYLRSSDPEVYQCIEDEESRQGSSIELIASENYASRAVMEALGSVLTNKYSEGYPGKRYYAGQQHIDRIENLAIRRAKDIFGADYVNVQPHSGTSANLAVFLAVLDRGDTILAMDLDQGGHLSHGHPLNLSGIAYRCVGYGVDRATGRIDMDEVERLAMKENPKLIIAGFSAYPRELDWRRFREIADRCGAILMGDISHIAGLIAGGAITNPVEYCDIVTTTTHKTLRGPRGAIILSRDVYSKSLAKAVFPGMQGGPHENVIGAKAVCFKEATTEGFRQYARQTIANAKHLGSCLESLGFRIVSSGTDNHLLLVDVFGSYGVSGKEAEILLELVGISCNKNMIPYDTRKPLDPSGIRLGTPAMTTRGMKESEMEEIAWCIAHSIRERSSETQKVIVQERIRSLSARFPIPAR